jgi:hypothetical protein
MTKTRIYTASLEMLPEGFQDWERGRRDIHWRDLVGEEMPDWLKRSRTFRDNSNPSVECYSGNYKDINLGQVYRFSQEGDYPGREGEIDEREGSPLSVLVNCAKGDLTGVKKFVTNIEVEY